MLSLLVSVLIVALILCALWWILSLIPLPPPLGQIVQAILVVIAVIWLIRVLVGFAPGHNPLLF